MCERAVEPIYITLYSLVLTVLGIASVYRFY